MTPTLTVTQLDRASVLFTEIRSFDKKILNCRLRALKTLNNKHWRKQNQLQRERCVAKAEYSSIAKRLF